MDGGYLETDKNALVLIAAVPEADRKYERSKSRRHEQQLWLGEGDLLGY